MNENINFSPTGQDPIGVGKQTKSMIQGLIHDTMYSYPESIIHKDVEGNPYKGYSQYEQGLSSESNQMYTRASNQSGLDMLTNGLVNLIPSTISKVLETGASLAGGLWELGKGALTNQNASIIKGLSDNPLLNSIRDFENSTKENVLPVYGNRDYMNANAVGKLGHAAWWLNDFADGAAFMASAWLTGYGVNALLGKGASITDTLLQAGKDGASKKVFANWAGEQLLKAKELTGLGTKHYLTSFVNTAFEAGAEGYDSSQQVKQYYNAKIQQAQEYGDYEGVKNLTKERDDNAEKAMTSTFMYNALLLSMTNTLGETKWFLGKDKALYNNLKKDLLAKAVSSEEREAVEALITKLSKPSVLKGAWKGIKNEAFIEENFQAAIQNRFLNKYTQPDQKDKSLVNDTLTDFTSILGQSLSNARGFVGNSAATALNLITLGQLDTRGLQTAPGTPEDDASQAMFAAVGLGGGMSAYGEHRDHIEQQQYLKDYSERSISIATNNVKLANQHMVDNIRQPLKTFSTTTTDAEGKVNTVDSIINPETGKMEEDPEAIVRGNKRLANIMESHRVAQQTILGQDSTAFDRNKQQTIAEYVYDILSSNHFDITEEELGIILDNIPMFNNNIMSELGETDIVSKNKEQMKEIGKNLLAIREKYSHPEDLIFDKTSTELDAMSQEDRDMTKLAQAHRNIRKSIRNDMARTEFYIKTNRDALLNSDSNLAEYADHTTPDKDVLNKLSPQEAGHYLDLVDLNESMEDISKNEKSLTHKIISDQLSRHLNLELNRREAKVNLTKIDEEINSTEDPTKKVELLEKRKKLVTETNGQSYLTDEEDKLDGFKIINDVITHPEGSMIKALYNIADTKERKVGAPRVYGTKYTNSIAARNQGRLIAEEVYDRVLAPIREQLEKEPLTIKELENISNQLIDIVNKFSSISVGSNELLKIHDLLEEKYNNSELKKYVDQINNFEDNFENTTEDITNSVKNFESIINTDDPDLTHEAIEILLETTQEIDDNLETVSKNSEEFGNFVQEILDAATQSVLPDEKFTSFQDLFKATIDKIINGELKPNSLETILNSKDDSISQKKTALSEMANNFKIFQSRTVSNDQIINDIQNNKAYEENPYQYNLENVFDVLFVENDQRTLAKFQHFLHHLFQIENEEERNKQSFSGEFLSVQKQNEIDAFVNIDQVIKTLTFLQNAKQAYSSRQDISDEFKKDMLDKIENLLEAYNLIANKTQGNIGKQNYKNQTYLNFKVEGVFKAFNFDYSKDPNEEDNLIKLLNEVFSSVGFKAHEEFDYQKKQNTYSNLMGMIALATSKMSQDQKTKFLSELDVRSNAIIDAMIKDYSLDKNRKIDKESIKNNPMKTLGEEFRMILPRLFPNLSREQLTMFDDLNNSSMFQILEHNNFLEALLKLDIDVESGLITAENATNIRNFIKNYLQPIEGIKNLKSLLNSKYSYLNLKNEIEKVSAETGFNLSQQQFASMMDLLMFLHSENTDDNSMGYAATFTGVLGSGKSTLLGLALKIFQKINSDLKLERIKGVGHVENASLNINKHIESSRTATLTADKITADYLSDTDVLIVDEAFALSNLEIEKLHLLIAAENAKRTGKKLKVIFAGDMSQNKASDENVLINKAGRLGLKINSTKGITFISPLATIYRTNITSIMDALMAFKDSRETVPVVNSLSNIGSLKEYSPDSLGVITVNPTELPTFFATRNTTNEAIVIVNNNNERNKFLDTLSKVTSKSLDELNLNVLSYFDVQSLTTDEVYILLNPEDKNHQGKLFTTKAFNTAMYTSIGRAKFFVGISPTSTIVHSQKQEIDSSVDFGITIKQQLQESQDNIENGFNNAAEKYFGEKKTVKKTKEEGKEENKEEEKLKEKPKEKPKEEGDTSGSNIDIEDSSDVEGDKIKIDEDGIETIPEDDVTGMSDDISTKKPTPRIDQEELKQHSPVQEVTNQNIKKVLEGRENTDNLTASIIAIKNGSEIFYHIVTPDQSGSYYSIAVLNKEELNSSFSHIPELLKTKKISKFKDGDKAKQFITPDSILAEYPIKQIIKANYAYSNVAEQKQSTDVRSNIMTWVQGFYGNDIEEASKALFGGKEVSKENIDWSKFKVKIVTRSLYNRIFLKDRGFNTGIIGSPIIEISGYNTKSANALPQFIILSQKDANIDVNSNLSNKWYDKTIRPIQEFTKAIVELETLFTSDPALVEANVSSKALFLGDGNRRLNTDVIDEFAKLGYAYNTPDLPLKENANAILKQILSTKEVGFDTSNLTSDDLDRLKKALDKVIKLLYSTKTKKLVIPNTEAAKNEVSQILGQNYALDFELSTERSKDFVYVRILNEKNELEKFETELHSLGNTEVTRAFNRFANGLRGSLFGTHSLNVEQEKNADGTTTKYLSPKSLLSQRHGARSGQTGAKKLTWTGIQKARLRWLAIGKNADSSWMNNIKPETVKTLKQATNDLIEREYSSGEFTGSNNILLDYLKELHPVEFEDAATNILSAQSIPITSEVLQKISEIVPGQQIKGDDGRVVKIHVDSSVSSLDLSKPESHNWLAENTSSEFLGYTPPSLILAGKVDNEEDSDKDLENRVEEHLIKFVDDEDDVDSKYKKEDTKKIFTNKNLYTQHNLSWLGDLLLSLPEEYFNNIRVYSTDVFKESIGTTYISSNGPVIIYDNKLSFSDRVHEFIHALTIKALDKPTTKEEKIFAKRIKNIQKLFDKIAPGLANKELKDIYTNTFSELGPKEFIANLANNEFVELLKLIPYKQSKSVFRKIVEAIAELFGLSEEANPTLFDLTVQSLEEFLNNKTDESDKNNLPLEPNKNDKEKLKEQLEAIRNKVENEYADKTDSNYLFKIKLLDSIDKKISDNKNITDATFNTVFNFAKGDKKIKDSTPTHTSELYKVKLNNIITLKKEFGNSVEIFNCGLFLIKREMYMAMEGDNLLSKTIPVSYKDAQSIAFNALKSNYAQVSKDFIKAIEKEAKVIPELNNVKTTSDLYNVYDNIVEKFNGLSEDDLLDDIGLVYQIHLHTIEKLIQTYHKNFKALETLSKNASNIYPKMLRFVFNNWSVFDNLETNHEEENAANLKNEIQENDEKNIVDSFSTNVKNFLSLIPIRDENDKIIDFVLPKTAIRFLSDLFHDDFNFYDLNNVEKVIEELEKVSNAGIYSKADKAVLNKLLNTFNHFISGSDVDNKNYLISNLPRNKTIFIDTFNNQSDAYAQQIYVIETVDPRSDIDLTGLTKDEALYLHKDKVNITKYSSIEEVIDKSSIKEDDAIAMYYKIKAYNDLANIKTYLGSLAKIGYIEVNEVTSFKKSNDPESKGALTRFSSVIKKSAVKATVKTKEHFLSSLIDILSGTPITINKKIVSINKDNFATIFNPIIQQIKKSTSTESTIKGLTDFLKLFGLDYIVKFDPETESTKHYAHLINDLGVAFVGLFNELQNNSKIKEVFNVNNKELGFNNFLDNAELLDEVRQAFSNSNSIDIFTTKLSQMAKKHSQVNSLTAIKTSDGKTLIDYIPTNTYREMIKDYMRQKDSKGSRYLNSPFFQHNIFVNGINTIKDGTTRFLLKKSGNYLFLANKLSSPKKLELAVSDMFFAQIARTDLYYQTIYQQGLSTKSETPRINFLSLSEVSQALDLMLKQLVNLDKNISEKEGYKKDGRLNFSVYDKAIEAIGEGDLEDETYKNKIKEKIFEYFYDEAKELSKTFKVGNIGITDSVPTAFSKIKQTFGQNNIEDSFGKHIADLIGQDKLSEDLEGFKVHPDTFKETAYPEDVDFNLMMFAFVANNYVNSYGLSQFAYGDFNQWGSIDNLGKRAQLSASPGYLSLIHDKYGTPRYANILMANDLITPGTEYRDLLEKFKINPERLSAIVNQLRKNKDEDTFSSIERTDGTILISPKFYYKLQKGFGSGLDLKNVMKDQAFGWSEEHVPDMSKPFKFVADVREHLGKSRVVENKDYVSIRSEEQVEHKLSDTDITKAEQTRLDKKFTTDPDLLKALKKAIGKTEQMTKVFYAKYLKSLEKGQKQSVKDFTEFVKTYPTTKSQTTYTHYPITVKTHAIGLKNAMIVLDDNFINSNTHNAANREELRKLRDFLDTEQHNGKSLDMLAFKSANKANVDSAVNVFNDEGKFTGPENVDSTKSTVLLDMSLFKIQYNPHSEDKTTAIPRQIIHFLSTINDPELAHTAYTALAQLQNILYLDKFQTSKLKKKNIEKLLKDSIKEGQDNFTLVNALNSGLSFDHPTILQKVISTLGSLLNKSASRIRVPGGKLILRSDVGYNLNRKDENGKTFADKLRIGKTADGTAYAEAAIPKHFLSDAQIQAIESGKQLFISPDMFGFRIPSGDLNAGLLIKVVDYYEADGNSNIAILPDLEIFKQGWDFDVDALFLLTLEGYKNDYSSNTLQLVKGDLIGFNPELGTKEVRYDFKNKEQFSDQEKAIIIEIQNLNKEKESIKDKETKYINLTDDEKSNNSEWNDLQKNKKEVNKNIKLLKDSRISLLKNKLIRSIMLAYLDPNNNYRILDVTTTKIVNEAINSLKELGIYSPNKAKDLSFIRDNIKLYSNVNEAANAIGIYAKGSAVNAYISRAGTVGNNHRSGLQEDLQFSINGFKVDRFDPAVNVFGNNSISYMVGNKLLNAFLDALKNPEIFTIGFNGSNANLVDTALSVSGMKFRDIVLLFNHPVIRKAFENRSIKDLIKTIESLIVKENGEYVDSYTNLQVSTQDLENAYKVNYSDLNVIVNKVGISLDEASILDDAENLVDESTSTDNTEDNENLEKINLPDKNLDLSLIRTLMLLHKLTKISSDKFKLLSLVNLPQDKPTTISQILDWQSNIKQLFKSEFLEDLVIKFPNLDYYSTAEEFEKSILNGIKSIRETYEDKSILSPSMGIRSEYVLEKNPHFAVALLQTLQYINNVKNNFQIFSNDAISIVNAFIPNTGTNQYNKGQAIQNGLFSLSDLLISSYASQILDTQATKITKLTKTNRLLQDVTGIDAFSNNLVLMLKALENYESNMILYNPNYSRNIFLEHVIFKAGKPATIKTAESFNLYSFETSDYHKAFNDLAKFDFIEQFSDEGAFIGYKVQFNPTKSESIIQQDLVTYAAFKYGLRGSSNNYINAMDPLYLANYTRDINKVFNNWLKYNQDTKDLKSIYRIYTALKYPHAVPAYNFYKKSEEYQTTSSKEDKEILVNDLAQLVSITGQRLHYDELISTHADKAGNLPNILKEFEAKNVLQQSFLILAGKQVIGSKVIGLYQRFKYGETLLTDKPYILEDHFRTDLPTMKFKVSPEYDIHSKTVLDDNDNEVENRFSIPYNPKFHTDKFIAKYIYGIYSSDIARHTISKLEITNIDSYIANKTLNFRVVENNIGYKEWNEEEETWEDLPSQTYLNRKNYENKSQLYQYTTRLNNFLPSLYQLGKKDVFVYITNELNLPFGGQVAKAFGNVKDVSKKKMNEIGTGDFAIVNQVNKLQKGRKGIGFGLSFNKIVNGKEVVGTKDDIRKAFKALLHSANEDKSLTFFATLRSTTDTSKFTIRELVNMLLSLNTIIPSNINFNEEFSDELSRQINNKKIGQNFSLLEEAKVNPVKAYNAIKRAYKGIENWEDTYINDIVGEIATNEMITNAKERFEKLKADALAAKKKEINFNFAISSSKEDITSIIEALSSDIVEDTAEEIKRNCEGSGGLTAKNGLAIGFTPGSKWTLVKDLKGPSHAQGGIDLSIDKGRVMFSSGGSIYHAANGLVVPSRNEINLPQNSNDSIPNLFPIIDKTQINNQIINNQYRKYIIQKNDTLSRISKQQKVPIQDLVNLNHIQDPNKILYGKSLDIPYKYDKPLQQVNIPSPYHPNRIIDNYSKNYNYIVQGDKTYSSLKNKDYWTDISDNPVARKNLYNHLNDKYNLKGYSDEEKNILNLIQKDQYNYDDRYKGQIKQNLAKEINPNIYTKESNFLNEFAKSKSYPTKEISNLDQIFKAFKNDIISKIGQGLDAYNNISDFTQLAKNGIFRKLNFFDGQDTGISTSVPKSVPNTEIPLSTKDYYTKYAKQANEETSYDAPKTNGRIYKSQLLDLSKASFGIRNRNDYTEFESSGLPITIQNPFKSPNELKLNDDNTVIGIDSAGKFVKGLYKDFKNRPDVKISKSFANKIVSFDEVNGISNTKNDSEHGNSKFQVPIVNVLSDKDNKTIIKGSLNILTSKNKEDFYGNIQGGRVIFENPNTKETYLVSGSLKEIKEKFNRIKKDSPYLVAYTLDNGTYSRGLSYKDNKFTKDRLRSYDLENTGGGNGLYIKNIENNTSKYKTNYYDTPNIRTKEDSSFKFGHSLKNEIKNIVLHYTAYADEPEEDKKLHAQYMTKGNNSSHIMISKDGTKNIYASPEQITFHAGKSKWNNRENVNDFGIGVEFQNSGKNDLTSDQVNSGSEYISELMDKYNLKLKDVITHKMIAPDRKQDLTDKQYNQIIIRLKELGYK